MQAHVFAATRLLPLLLLLPFAPAAIAAQTPAPQPACSAPEHRQFDFWIGEWDVTAPDGRRAGSNRITRISDGCAILEEWKSAAGSTGVSINFFDARAGTWNQHWVGGGGMILHLSGRLENGEMVMHGEHHTPQGRVKDRVRWVPEADGRVRQIWELSSDDGRTWQPSFNGLYVRSR